MSDCRGVEAGVIRLLAGGVAAVTLAACGTAGGEPSDAGPSTSPAHAPATSSDQLPAATRALDSMAALGHSGLTGTMTDPRATSRDAHENSWATGSNPAVRSIYQRLLTDHPALEGHNYNYAVNGATIDDLDDQYDALMSDAEVAPDLLILQYVDNDLRCDGTDPANAELFGKTLDEGLERIAADLPDAQIYLSGPWASVRLWTAWAVRHPDLVGSNSGDGPCDVFDEAGRPRAAGIRSMQGIVDSYQKQMEIVCTRHPGCYTDERAMETVDPTDRDLSTDLHHLSIAGHRKYAELAWSVLPEEIITRR